ncbi:MAG TPA: ABC transporter permease [Candidatus Acidoferrales bacterium]|nr:ABC transporter permease [Candidatus Acidoferrales bacterium]
MKDLLQDLRFGLRMFVKSPGFALVAMLTLALGIGANTAIFSLTDQVLLRYLPVENPGQLVILRSPGPNPGTTNADWEGDATFSYPIYKDLREQAPVFSGLLAKFSVSVSVAGQGETELAAGELVSGNYFEVLGVKPAIGRVFSREDETAPGANNVAVLSYGYWSRHFGANPDVLNKAIAVNGIAFTVVGVSRAGFDGIQIGQAPDIFIPVTMKAQMTPNWDGLMSRRDHWLAIVGRLKPGFTIEKAEAGIAPPYRAILEAEAPIVRISEKGHDKYVGKKMLLEPASHGRPVLQGEAKAPLETLMGMVGLVLLISCANLASLLVARSESRQREIALRLAMGAGRLRLVRQLLTESLLLAAAGGIAGVTLASWLLSFLVGSIPARVGAVGLEARLDGRVLGFAFVLTLITGLLFGLVPAWRATRTDLQSTLKDQGASVSEGKTNVRFRKWLMVSQMALTAVLLVVAGFFAQSLVNLKNIDLGVRTDHLLEFSIAPELNRYTPDQTIALAQRLREQVGALPGVRAVSAASIRILDDSDSSSNITAEGYTAQEDENTHVRTNRIGPDYFATMGTPLLAGREFTDGDRAGSAKVAIINEKMAKRYFAGKNPIGMHFAFGAGDTVHPDIEIVGLVKDSKHSNERDKIFSFAYLPYEQDKTLGQLTFYVRTNQDPDAIAAALRSTVRSDDANLPVFHLETMTEQVDDLEFNDRLLTFFSLCLGLLAALLAAIGLYGVMAYMVARRTREIGIRMALGASQGNAQWLILREVVLMSAAGLAIGLPAAYGLGRLVESQLFGVKAGEPAVFLAAAVLLALVAMTAGWLPSRKAAGVDPMVALRYE